MFFFFFLFNISSYTLLVFTFIVLFFFFFVEYDIKSHVIIVDKQILVIEKKRNIFYSHHFRFKNFNYDV
jgi:hypothetical protein